MLVTIERLESRVSDLEKIADRRLTDNSDKHERDDTAELCRVSDNRTDQLHSVDPESPKVNRQGNRNVHQFLSSRTESTERPYESE